MNFCVPKWQPAVTALLIATAIFSALNYQGHDYSYRWNLLALFVVTMLAGLHCLSAGERDLRLRQHAALLAYAAYLFWGLLGLLWSAVPSDSLMAWLSQVSGLFALYLGYQAKDRQWRYFMGGLLALGLAVVLYTLYQGLALHIERPAGFLINWNSNAAFIALTMVPFAGSLLQTAGIGQRLGLAAYMLLGTMAIGITESRGGMLVLSLGLLPICALRIRSVAAWQSVAWLVVSVLFGLVLAEWLQGGAMGERIGRQLQEASAASLGSGRHALWQAGWQMYLQKPWLGWGLNAYHWLYPQFRNPLLLEDGQLAHNDYLDVLIGLGPIGLLLIGAFAASVVRLGWQSWRKGDLEALALSAAGVAMLAHSWVDFDLFQSAMLLVLGLYVGRASAQLRPQLAPVLPAALSFSTALRRNLTGVSMLVLGLWLGSLFIGLRYVHLALQEEQPNRRLDLLNQGEVWLPYLEQIQSLQASSVANAVKNGRPEGVSEQEHNALAEFALAKLERALAGNPLRAESYLHKADVLSERRDEGAIAAYRQALQHDPYDLDARCRLVDWLRQAGRPAEAKQYLLDSLDRAYFADYRKGLGLLLRLQGLLEAEGMSEAQRSELGRGFNELVEPMMQQPSGVFVLQSRGLLKKNDR